MSGYIVYGSVGWLFDFSIAAGSNIQCFSIRESPISVFGLALDIVFRFIIEYSSLMDFGP